MLKRLSRYAVVRLFTLVLVVLAGLAFGLQSMQARPMSYVAPPQPEERLIDLAAFGVGPEADIETAPTYVPLDERVPAWRRAALPVPPGIGNKPRIALVIDDLGLNAPMARRTIALPGPVTLSFMTYAERLPELAAAGRAAGHEIMLHVPMAPMNAHVDAGTNVLETDLPPEELKRRLDWALGRLEDGYVGINNHMGSRFTADAAGMNAVMAELRRRGLLFLDSLTSGRSLGLEIADAHGVPAVARDVFLDHEIDRAFIEGQLVQLERLARHHGSAIGIAHPHALTLEILEDWIPELEARGLALVPVSALVGRRHELVRRDVDE